MKRLALLLLLATSTLTAAAQQTAHMQVSFNPSIARVDPGQSQVFRIEVQSFDPSEPGDIRVHFEAVNGTITNIDAGPMWTCSIAGATADCTAARLHADCRCSDPMFVTLRARDDNEGATASLNVRATSNLPDAFPTTYTATLETYRVLRVTNTADAGAGSLRQAMLDVNTHCTPGPCRIGFEIPPPVPAEGWFTITPATELPPITARRVRIAGDSQTAFTGDTNPAGPEIAIAGYRALRGLAIHSPCDVVVSGLTIGWFFGGDGLSVGSEVPCLSPTAPDQRIVTRNHIGVDPTATFAWPNNRGVNLTGAQDVRLVENRISRNLRSGVWMWNGFARVLGNIIEDNGKSGVFFGPETRYGDVLGNVINRHPDMGVAVARGATSIDIRQNSMRDNLGLGIDWGLDGVSSPADDDARSESNAPVLLSARWNGTATELTLALHSRPFTTFGFSWQIDVYANDSPNSDGERWVHSSFVLVVPPANDVVTTIEIPRDLRGQWLNATSTRLQVLFSKPPDETSALGLGDGVTQTSELSNSVRVE